MKSTSRRGGRSNTRNCAARRRSWSSGLRVSGDGAGMVVHAGVVLPRLLADRVGLTTAVSEAVARKGFSPAHDRGRVLVDVACALGAGARGLTDAEAVAAQLAILDPDDGRGVSDTTIWRALGELSDQIGPDGLPRRRLADALADARKLAWERTAARHQGLPAVRVGGRPLTRETMGADGRTSTAAVTVIRLDATLIEAASNKANAAGTYRGGWGFHPLTAWCSNIGDNLAVMLRPGNAGSFTAADHLAVLDAAIAQVPAAYRRDLLVTVDGAGASHALITHLTQLNTAAEHAGRHGGRGRRVEYSIGWPVDERTMKAIALAPEHPWSEAVCADGDLDEHAEVIDLTGLLRSSLYGELLPNWPADLRVIARRVARAAGEQAELGQDPNWRYQAFATNTKVGQIQWLDARHRTQAHVEDSIKELKNTGGRLLPMHDWAHNSAWILLAAIAVSLISWLRAAVLTGDLASAVIPTLRYRLFSAPARLVAHARTRLLRFPSTWPYSAAITAAWALLHPG